MKIFLIGPGNSPHIAKWIQYFFSQGHEIILVSEDIPCEYQGKITHYELTSYPKKCNIPFFHYFFYYITFCITGFKIQKIIRRHNPDIIHAHYIQPFGYLIAFFISKPFILSPWGSDILIFPKKSSIQRLLTKITLFRASVVISDSDTMTKQILEIAGISKKIVKIYNGVDTQFFSPNSRDMSVFRKIHINLGQPIIISTRNFERVYNISMLIQAIPRVVKKCPEVVFIIAGSGSMKQNLHKLANELKLESHIRFIGYQLQDSLSCLLASSDVYVSTSNSDSTSSSLLEAMSSSLPVVVTDVPANREWILNDVNGYVVPLDNAEILAEKIIILLNNDDIRSKFGERNRKKVVSEADYYNEMKKVEGLYITM